MNLNWLGIQCRWLSNLKVSITTTCAATASSVFASTSRGRRRLCGFALAASAAVTTASATTTSTAGASYFCLLRHRCCSPNCPGGCSSRGSYRHCISKDKTRHAAEGYEWYEASTCSILLAMHLLIWSRWNSSPLAPPPPPPSFVLFLLFLLQG